MLSTFWAGGVGDLQGEEVAYHREVGSGVPLDSITSSLWALKTPPAESRRWFWVLWMVAMVAAGRNSPDSRLDVLEGKSVRNSSEAKTVPFPKPLRVFNTPAPHTHV